MHSVGKGRETLAGISLPPAIQYKKHTEKNTQVILMYEEGSINNLSNNSNKFEYSNAEINTIFKADVKVLLNYLKAKYTNKKDSWVKHY